MPKFHDKHFPNENDDYRSARDDLLSLEMELRDKVKEVADARLALPLGGKVPTDYVFEEGAADLEDERNVVTTKFSELFQLGKDTLLIYSFMFPPDGTPCPACTSLLDSLNANAPYIKDRLSLAIVAKASITDIRKWARGRNWQNLRLLSSANNDYNRDYYAENEAGAQEPLVNVFVRPKRDMGSQSGDVGAGARGKGWGKNKGRDESPDIFHFWGSELLFVPPSSSDMHTRHVDQIWPIWNIFDLTPEGRGEDWCPDPNLV